MVRPFSIRQLPYLALCVAYCLATDCLDEGDCAYPGTSSLLQTRAGTSPIDTRDNASDQMKDLPPKVVSQDPSLVEVASKVRAKTLLDKVLIGKDLDSTESGTDTSGNTDSSGETDSNGETESEGSTGTTSSGEHPVLDRHNLYRCMHGVDPLTWDDQLAASAQAWADRGKFEHTQGGVHGENLAMGQSDLVSATDAWYDEIKESEGGLVTKFKMETGHYTAVVWKGTTKLGCGQGQGSMGALYVCQYMPAGNMGGAYSENVLAPTKTKEECAKNMDAGTTSGFR